MEMNREASGSDYEVFLSFRGPDTRQGLADVLYDFMDRAGIRVFRDDDELAIGDKIETILQAIEGSQICVPIFSETFAASKWCLREVRRMAKLNKVVVPIFYKVTPADVKLKTPVYKNFIAEHETKYGKNKVEKWEGALKTISKIKGREVLDTSYTKFCKMFIEELLIKLKPRKRYDLENLVGMDNQLESALKLLDIGVGDVRYMLIYGIGGIGKTTLAKVIFDKLSANFDGCCFLEGVRESSRRDGLENLQKKLRDSLDPKSPASSKLSRDIRERFQGRKVLIILDDVDTGEQVDKLVGKSSFCSGSRIIITTRNKNVLNECEDLDEGSVQSLEMSMLQHDEALGLFKIYAFRKVCPPAIFESLADEAISNTGGLPLAIKVIASLLRGKSEGVWRDVIARSRKIPPKEVKNRLKISYDELDHEQKQIFLDIACFFIGTTVSKASYMWEASDLYPTYGLEVLASMSLVKITDENVIWMHDQLRDLGRDIVREENINDPTKRSRIWLQEDGVQVLLGKEGKEMVEALSLRIPLNVTLTDEHCASFRNMRFLELAGAMLEAHSDHLFTKLTWLSWHFCHSNLKIRHLHLKNLVILDLSHSFIDENWGGWSLIQVANNLKVLDLRSCHNLTCTPDFSKNHTLERLILSHCSKLAKIGSSIGNLRRLRSLDLGHCYSLRGLPEEIGLLKDLEEILVSGQYGTFILPNSIGDLKLLSSLTLIKLKIGSIPDSIGQLVKLKHLSVSSCLGMKEMPESLGNLESLVDLDLSNWHSGANILPNSIGGLLKLKELSVGGTYSMKEVPDSLQLLKSLVRLDLSRTQISDLPAAIGDLQELQVFNLSRCNVRKLPASIGMLKKLVELNAHSCKFLVGVPLQIGKASCLRRLDLSNSCIRTLPSTIHQLSLLEELYLEGCHQLEEVPELPQSLNALSVSFSGLRELHDTHSTDELHSNNLDAILKLTKLKKLELGITNAAIELLDLSSLTQLESLRLFMQPLTCTSSSSNLSHDSAEIELPCLSNLKNLRAVGFRNFLMEEGLEKFGLKDLQNLEYVEIKNCSNKLIEISLAKRLRFLSIGEVKGSLPDLSHLKALTSLKVHDCPGLMYIGGLGELESLNTLCIYDCDSLVSLGDLSKLKKLSYLSLDECPDLTYIGGIDGLFLEYLSIVLCESIKNCDALLRRCKRGSYNEMRFENYCC